MSTETIVLLIATLLSGVIGAFVSYLFSRKKTHKIEEELENTKNTFPKDLEIINDASDVLNDRLFPIIIEQAKKEKHIKIENFGLDLETVIPWINQKILFSKELENVHFEMKTLIINPESPYIKNYINEASNISSSTIFSSIDTAKNLVHQELYKFKLEMREYDLPPILHGFLLNDEHLFIGFTEIINGKLLGGTKPYLHLSKKAGNISTVTSHYFSFFKHWFNYYWNQSNEVANVKK